MGPSGNPGIEVCERKNNKVEKPAMKQLYVGSMT
jgi:hypothetical protein